MSRVLIRDIQERVAAHYGLTRDDLVGPRRFRRLAWPRQTAIWLAKQRTSHSLCEIGRRFGGRDHTTVLHAISAVECRLAIDPDLADDVARLERELGA